MLQLLKRYVDPLAGTFHHQPGRLKMVYLGPIRALVQEVAKSWKARFSTLGVTCEEMTGDANSSAEELAALDNCDIICTTPEMFGRCLCVQGRLLVRVICIHLYTRHTDSLTRKRKSSGGLRFFSDVWLTCEVYERMHVFHRLCNSLADCAGDGGRGTPPGGEPWQLLGGWRDWTHKNDQSSFSTGQCTVTGVH